MQFPPEAWEAVRFLKDKIQSTPMLVFPDFDRPFLLETDASKEGLGAVLSQKQDAGATTPSCLGVIPSHHQRKTTTALSSSSFLSSGVSLSTSKSILRMLFVVQTDNNPLTYVLTTPNLDATGHRWVGMSVSFEFTLEHQKGADNGAANTLSQVPICHNCQML